jgi:putative tryptophan/tyrosine transport system substrate-binding protein
MNQKVWLITLCSMIFTCMHSASAQQPKKMPHIGYLGGNVSTATNAFRQGLGEHGWIEGQNIVVEYRVAEAKTERFPELAAELVRLKVDLIVAASTPAAQATQQATKTIPIVFIMVSDPVASGIVASLARPGANITGLSNMLPEMSGKLLELLKEAVPAATRVAVLYDPANAGKLLEFKELQAAAPALGMKLQSLEVHTDKEVDGAIATMTKARLDGLVTFIDAVTNKHRQRIVDFAAKHRVPSIYQTSEFAEAGGLMSYGLNPNEMFRRAAAYVDKILKGTKPADIPVERPIKFQFVINIKTAKQLGLKIPPNMLVRADRVIK